MVGNKKGVRCISGIKSPLRFPVLRMRNCYREPAGSHDRHVDHNFPLRDIAPTPTPQAEQSLTKSFLYRNYTSLLYYAFFASLTILRDIELMLRLLLLL